MTRSYAIREDVAWVDAADGGRTDNAVWISRLDTGELFELRNAGWLVWSMLADGIGDAEAMAAEIHALEITVDFGDEGLDGFLSALEAQGLVTAVT
ncbi:hypothetical protein FVO59_09220 [Microbacterium esteraromaticum]|uniref:PqqD family protein n=1 Tax=Microbacterium esteraromaticum TaxID=57043 RepID=A0A7D7WH23_9MICO|nr:hypothetical protein [Microbacterium esteraromaticum]QMU97374.1 hypothetical protein FVO59_09220 [Microbacterium esteraromaticum]